MADVGVHIVTYNGLKYLPALFASLANQTFRNVSIRILDNASTDGTREWLNTYVHRFLGNAELTLSDSNTLFVGGHNQLFARAHEPYIQLINQDTQLEPTYIEMLVKHMEAHPHVGSAAGVLMNLANSNTPHARIDSAGIRAHRNRSYSEYKAGEYIEKIHFAQWPVAIDVFGVSGTLPMYRTQAIKQVADENELFDPLFEMYKEDVELAIRLQKAGWTAQCVPSARAYHDRTVAQHTNRATRSFKARYCSYRNHLYTLIKHETWSTFIPDMFYIVPHEIAKAVYLLCREPRVLGAWKDVFQNTRYVMRKKRTYRNQSNHFSVSHKYLVPTKL